MFIPFFLKFFPLKINNLWIYKVYEKFDEKEYAIVKVIIEEKIPMEDRIIFIFSYYLDNEELKKESYVVNKEGLFLYARKLEDNLIVYDPLVNFLPVNFEDLSWWNWEGKAGIIPSKIRFENRGFVEEGTYKIYYVEENKLGKSTYNLYLKRDVGIIKEEADTPYFSYISELMDYNVGIDDFSMFSFESFGYQSESVKDEDYFEQFLEDFDEEKESETELSGEFIDNYESFEDVNEIEDIKEDTQEGITDEEIYYEGGYEEDYEQGYEEGYEEKYYEDEKFFNDRYDSADDENIDDKQDYYQKGS